MLGEAGARRQAVALPGGFPVTTVAPVKGVEGKRYLGGKGVLEAAQAAQGELEQA